MSPARPEGFGARGEIWRFKIDPVSGWIVATGLLGAWNSSRALSHALTAGNVVLQAEFELSI
jgi:hypothetical protein